MRALDLISSGILYFMSLTCFAQSDASQLVYKINGKEIAYPRLSKDGSHILYQSNQNGNWQLFIMDMTNGTQTPLLTDSYNNNFPDWSFDNQWVAFVSDRDGNEEVYMMRTNGTDLKRITNNPERDIHPYFSPDGRYLLFNSTRGNGSFDIFRYTLFSGDLKQLSVTSTDETCARYSPDMKHIVYLQNGPTSDDVMMADSLNNNQQNISGTPTIRDGWPMFSYDGKWIFYSSMESGSFCIYKIKLDGSAKTQLTHAKTDEEDARVSLSRDGKNLIYNKRHDNTLEVRELIIPHL